MRSECEANTSIASSPKLGQVVRRSSSSAGPGGSSIMRWNSAYGIGPTRSTSGSSSRNRRDVRLAVLGLSPAHSTAGAAAQLPLQLGRARTPPAARSGTRPPSRARRARRPSPRAAPAITSRPRSPGHSIRPAITIGPTGCRRELERSRDAEVAAAAVQRPEQVGVLVLGSRAPARRRRSPARPRAGCRTRARSLRSSQPEPPPSVKPATPVVDTRPPVVASPCSCVAASNSPQVTPAPQRAVRSRRVHLDRPSSCARRRPGRRRPSTCPRPSGPPLRTAVGSPFSRPNRTAAATSSALAHCAITAGRLSIIALKSARASS